MKPKVKSEKQGLLLVGHGTREAEGVAEFFAIAEQVAKMRPKVAVEACFLELADPTIATGVAKLAERGVEQIVVMPLLLFAAGHAKHDVPTAVAVALKLFPHIRVVQAGHLGCHSAILEQSAERFYEAVDRKPTVPRERTVLVFVGRGSHDEDALREMHEFVASAPQADAVNHVEVCFLAMAQPLLKETLARVAQNGYERVVVQPHLLFQGLLLAEIRETVAVSAAKHPPIEWLVTNHLGPTPKVSTVILERSDQAGASNTSLAARAQVSAATTLM